MNFTKEEIALCKKIAEKHRKEVKWGDVVCGKDGVGIVATISTSVGGKKIVSIDCYQGKIPHYEEQEESIIPLWQISDCLEFLRNRRSIHGEVRLAYIDHHDRWFVHIFEENSPSTSKVIMVESGMTPLEACLKAVLAIVEEKNGKI